MNYDPSDLQGQEVQRERSEEEARLLRLQESADFRWLMRQKPFRRFAWRLLREAGVYRSSYAPGDEGRAMARAEGQREIGLWFMQEVTAICPEAYELMLAE